MRLKTLAEIYTMHSYAQLCNLNFFVKQIANMLLNFAKFSNFSIFWKKSATCLAILTKIEIGDQFKGVHCVDLGESFPTSVQYLLAKFDFDTAENEPCKI